MRRNFAVDMDMMHNLNGREWSVRDIFNLFDQMDESFKSLKAYKVKTTTYTICEAVWAP
jgi:hypothetical protein